jgi:hypothetical protein
LVVRTDAIRAPAIALRLVVVALVAGAGPRSARAAPVFTVVDSIRTETVGTVSERALHTDPLVCNASRRACVMVSFHGDLRDDTNVYTLRLFDAAPGSNAPPRVIFQIRTDSNRPGIGRPRWIAENRLAFVTHGMEGSAELRSVDVATGAVRLEASSSREIVAFSASDGGETLVAALLPPRQPLFPNVQARHSGRVVTDETLSDLITETSSGNPLVATVDKLMIVHRGRTTYVPAPPNVTQYMAQLNGISLSPDGRWLAVQQDRSPTRAPSSWRAFAIPEAYATATGVALVDLKTGAWSAVVNAPGFATAPDQDLVHWSADSSSFAYSTHLPPDLAVEGPRSGDPRTPYLVRFDTRTRRGTILAQGFYEFHRAGMRPGAVVAQRQPYFDRFWPAPGAPSADLYLSASNALVGAAAAKGDSEACVLSLDQSVWSPPVERARCPGGSERVVLEVAPELKSFNLARVEEVEFTDIAGVHRKAGLYVPPGVTGGGRLPLVVQTHGWDPDIFTLDGAASAGYAAQALAAKGYFVVQCTCSASRSDSEEAKEGARNIDALVDALAAKYPIDTERLALVGWSRTGLEVRAAAVSAKHHFRAAVLSDAQADSYIEYLSSFNTPTDYYKRLELAVGGVPIGQGLVDWTRRVSIYGYEGTQTAIRIAAFGPDSLIGAWEDYFILKRLGKAVELVYLPDSAHDPVRPLERLTVQQGSVDWISRWLGPSGAAGGH